MTRSTITAAARAPQRSTVVEPQLLARVRAEYDEMPGLCLTRAQAQRLWGLEAESCDAVLDRLMASRFLRKTPRGYMKA